ncbi:MAG: hypothetical protein Q8O98_02000 [bacterium]|nr:hypothetical protein [bacterium]
MKKFELVSATSHPLSRHLTWLGIIVMVYTANTKYGVILIMLGFALGAACIAMANWLDARREKVLAKVEHMLKRRNGSAKVELDDVVDPSPALSTLLASDYKIIVKEGPRHEIDGIVFINGEPQVNFSFVEKLSHYEFFKRWKLARKLAPDLRLPAGLVRRRMLFTS